MGKPDITGLEERIRQLEMRIKRIEAVLSRLPAWALTEPNRRM